MSRGVARVGDRTSGRCYHSSHAPNDSVPAEGTITTGSPTIVVNDRKAARLGDTVTTECGHTGVIITASTDVIGDEPPIARINDKVGAGDYIAIIMEASPDVFANE